MRINKKPKIGIAISRTPCVLGVCETKNKKLRSNCLLHKCSSLILFSVLMMIILFVNGVFAFAVSSAYWEDNPLKIMPGETQNIKIVLQNMAGTENITLKGKISEGADIAKIKY